MRRVALRLAVVLAVLAPGAALGAPAASAQEGGSVVTRSGAGEFADLQVTVSQTTDLINQVVRVSWTGGAPTGLLPVRTNFLQIMQCWGDDPAGPEPAQCQFGGTLDGDGDGFVTSRLVQAPGPASIAPDPAETLLPIDDPATPLNEAVYPAHVPFWPVGSARPTRPAINNLNDFFNDQLTNEVPVARTDNGGTGEVLFEVQTVRQSSGMACGEVPLDGSVGAPRGCWLVVVPRGETEADGSTPGVLRSSPLSAGNWAKRIQFPLTFLPVGRACPIGAVERAVLGHEPATDAVSRWQPALCADGGTAFAYTQLTDDLARAAVLEGARPGLAVLSDPISPDLVLPDRPLVYAPIALSGLAVAFAIESQPGDPSDPANGVPMRSMRLTPRLVAKLLSQSYFEAIEGYPADKVALAGNPRGLTDDPEFLALNPEYAGKDAIRRPADAIVQLGTADSTELLWRWVMADGDARTFLEGTPDPDGMRVNPANRLDATTGIVLPAPTYPRNDTTCGVVEALGATLRTCTLDTHPFANDMHEAGRAAARGDTLGRVAAPPEPSAPEVARYSRVARQGFGQRSVLAVVDTATAARYGLPTAALRNGAGRFVLPDTAGLTAGAAAMVASDVDGVLRADAAATEPAAYPLPILSYAVTSPPALETAAGAEYATFLRFAAGEGQTPGIGPGQLPAGYAPLSAELRGQTETAAARVQVEAGVPAGAGPPATEGGPDGGAGVDTAGGVGIGGPGTTDGGSGPADPVAAVLAAVPGPPGAVGDALAAAAGAATPVLPGAPQTVAATRPTPSSPAPAVGALLAALLVGGGVAAALAPAAHLAETRRAAGGGEGTGRTGARGLAPWPAARPAWAARSR